MTRKGSGIALLMCSLVSLGYSAISDPTIEVTTSAEFLASGNEEEMVSVSGDQITRDRLTSGRLGAWSATTAPPSSGEAAASLAYNGYLYVLGGYDGTFRSDVRFAPIAPDGTLSAWSTTTPLPSERYFHTAAAYNGYFYVLGGYNGADLDDVQTAKVAADGTLGPWTATTPLPGARSGHASAVYNGFLYVLGGFGVSYLNEVLYAPLRADGTLGQWSATTSLPVAVNVASCAAYNGYLYVIGGFNNPAYYDDVRYAKLNPDGTVGAWMATSSLPAGRRRHSSVAYNGYLYIFGGDGGSGDFNDAWYAAIQAGGGIGAWRQTASFTTARGGARSVAYKGRVYLVGGYALSSNSYLNDVQTASIEAPGGIGSWGATISFNTARNRHKSVVYNGYLYVIGGSIGGSYFNDVQYAPINADGTIGAWASTTPFSTVRSGHTAVVYNGYLYVIGGTNQTSNLSDVQYAPINADGTVGVWTTTTAMPTERQVHSSIVYNGYVYVIGGNGGTGPLSDVQVAPINAGGTVGVWTTTTAMPTERQEHSSVVYNGYLYVIGGNSSGFLSDVQVAPINADGTIGAWSATTALPTGRQNASSVAYNGYLYVTGGENGAFLSDVQYAPINADGTIGNWVTTTPFATARIWHSSVTYNGCLYVIGGAGTQGPLSDVQYVLINVHGTAGPWSATTSFATTRARHTSAAGNGYVYVIGGHYFGVDLSDVQYAPIGANGALGAWASTTPLASTRSDHTSFAHSGYLYVIGGRSGAAYLNDAQVAPINADGTLGAWSTTTSLPAARAEHASAVYNGYVYVIGGNNGSAAVNDVQVAPINANGTIGAWATTTAFATGRVDLTSVAHNGSLYVIGGRSSSGFHNDVQVASINANGTIGTWSTTTALTTARFEHASVAHNGYVYVIGGKTSDSGGYLNDVQVAPINADGTLGTWWTTTAFATARTDHSAVAYKGTLYVNGGYSGGPYLNDVQLSTLNTPTPRGYYSRRIDLGSDLTVNSILINGSASNRGTVRLQYRLAPSASAVYGVESVTDPVPLGTAVNAGASARYVWLRVTLDDTFSVAVNPDATNQRNVTDITVNYGSPLPSSSPSPSGDSAGGGCGLIGVEALLALLALGLLGRFSATS